MKSPVVAESACLIALEQIDGLDIGNRKRV